MSESESESAHLFRGMNSRLYQAADQGNVGELNDLIDQGKLNIVQEFTGLGNSVLHIALSRGINLQFIERLLQVANIESVEGREFLRVKNSHGNTALHFAALYGPYELVKKFVGAMEGDVEAGDSLVRIQNSEGNTAIHEAAKEGNCNIVRLLVNNKARLVNRNASLTSILNHKGESALFIASERGHVATVETLLSPITNIHEDDLTSVSNSESKNKSTPLHAAVLRGHAGVVKKLLKNSRKLANQTDGCGRTAMHMLALSFPVTFPVYLGDTNWVRGGDFTEIARLLLEEDNSQCYKLCQRKQTPLHMAAEGGKYLLVDILLRYGRDCIEAVDDEGRKPLHLAVMNALNYITSFQKVEFYVFKNMLLSLMSRESLNHRDNLGRTPLHIAVKNTEKDPLLYEGIKSVLRMKGALVNPEILEDTRGKEPSTDKLVIKARDISINAVLIATVSFAAAFTLPGGLDSQQKALLINNFFFKIFVTCDAFSFCSSMASAILVQYACAGEKEDLSLSIYSVNLLWTALLSLVAAFGAALQLVISPSPSLVSTVWTLVLFVPLTINVARGNSKLHIFQRERFKLIMSLRLPFVIIGMIGYVIWDVLDALLCGGLMYVAVHWTKRLSMIVDRMK